MKKLLLIALTLGFAGSLALRAAEAAKKDRTPEQKQLWKEMVQKYDTNSNKKLETDELAKVSADDKKKMEDAGVWPKARKKKNQ